MVRSCAAVGCTNRWKSDSPVYVYRIPKDSNLKKKWLNNIKREVKLPKDEIFLFALRTLKKNILNETWK